MLKVPIRYYDIEEPCSVYVYCYVMLRYVIPYVMLCYVMLFFVMLCYVLDVIGIANV